MEDLSVTTLAGSFDIRAHTAPAAPPAHPTARLSLSLAGRTPPAVTASHPARHPPRREHSGPPGPAPSDLPTPARGHPATRPAGPVAEAREPANTSTPPKYPFSSPASSAQASPGQEAGGGSASKSGAKGAGLRGSLLSARDKLRSTMAKLAKRSEGEGEGMGLEPLNEGDMREPSGDGGGSGGVVWETGGGVMGEVETAVGDGVEEGGGGEEGGTRYHMLSSAGDASEGGGVAGVGVGAPLSLARRRGLPGGAPGHLGVAANMGGGGMGGSGGNLVGSVGMGVSGNGSVHEGSPESGGRLRERMRGAISRMGSKLGAAVTGGGTRGDGDAESQAASTGGGAKVGMGEVRGRGGWGNGRAACRSADVLLDIGQYQVYYISYLLCLIPFPLIPRSSSQCSTAPAPLTSTPPMPLPLPPLMATPSPACRPKT